MAALPRREQLVLHELKGLFEGTLSKGAGMTSGPPRGREGDGRSAVYTIVATQRPSDELLNAVESFVDRCANPSTGDFRAPSTPISWVLGDTSEAERVCAQRAQDQDMQVMVIPKAAKGEWDEGAGIRDERVVAQASHVFAFDGSARSREYRRLAERMRDKAFTEVV